MAEGGGGGGFFGEVVAVKLLDRVRHIPWQECGKGGSGIIVNCAIRRGRAIVGIAVPRLLALLWMDWWRLAGGAVAQRLHR